MIHKLKQERSHLQGKLVRVFIPIPVFDIFFRPLIIICFERRELIHLITPPLSTDNTFRDKLITGSPSLSRFSAALINPSMLHEASISTLRSSKA
jgi:hypothetical protein